MVWVKPTQRTNDQVRIIGKGSPRKRHYGIWIQGNNQGRDTGQPIVEIHGHSGGVLRKTVAHEMPLNEWTHLAMSFEQQSDTQGNFTFYINGVRYYDTVSTEGARQVYDENEPLTLARALNHHCGFIGELKEAIVYNFAMAAEAYFCFRRFFYLSRPFLMGRYLSRNIFYFSRPLLMQIQGRYFEYCVASS